MLHYLGYPKKHSKPIPFASLIDDCVKEAQHLIDPRYLFTQESVAAVLSPVTLVRESLAHESRIVSDLLDRCTSVVIFVATVGDRLETTAHNLASEENLMRSYVLDAIGSAAVEQVVEHVQKAAKKFARSQGLTASRHFSPGHCDWDIRNQRALFQIADGGQVGVRLSDLGVMIPRKSVSGVIGLGPAELEVASYNPCATCTREVCIGRRPS